MLKVGLLVALLVALASAAPKPCCGPTQYVAGVGVVVGLSIPSEDSNEGYYTVLYGAFDFTAKKYGYYVELDFLNGTSEGVRVIQDYVQGFQWVILDDVKQCFKQPTQGPEPSNCVPANATHLGQIYMGGDTKLWTDSWSDRSYTFPEYQFKGAVTLQTEIGSCNPVASSFLGGNQDVAMMTGGSVFNMTLGITDPDRWFGLPSFCNMNNKIRQTRSIPKLDFLTIPRFF